jgi:hypothetical protein
VEFQARNKTFGGYFKKFFWFLVRIDFDCKTSKGERFVLAWMVNFDKQYWREN